MEYIDCPLSHKQQEKLFDALDDDLKSYFPQYLRRDLRRWKRQLKLKNSSFNNFKKEEKMKLNVLDAGEFLEKAVQELKGMSGKVVAPKIKKTKGGLKEVAVLLFSDFHYGRINKILNPETGEVETTYNKQIAVNELNRLLDGIFTIDNLLRGSYQIDKLHVFGLGDLVEGDLIFEGQKFFIEGGVGQQVIEGATHLANFLKVLLGEFKEIEFINVIGNHGRFTKRRSAAPPANNFDYFVGKILETMFANEPRIKFVCPESRFFIKDIFGWKYYLHHGEEITGWMGLPYYGIVRQAKARKAETNYNIDCMGHWHTRMEIPVGSTAYTLVNGSFVPKDENAFVRLGVLSKPEQYYFGVSPRRPRSWSFSLDLKRS